MANSQGQRLAKITRPSMAQCLLRPRLFERLDRALEKPVVWVEGSPGGGKTVLASSYLENRDHACLWYLLDVRDGEPSTFFRFLRQAAEEVGPPERMALPYLTPEYQNVEAFTRNFFEELYGRMPHPFLLVFDDVQEVPRDSGLHEIFRYATDVLPASGALMFLSRAQLVPSLARARAHGDVATLTDEHLRLTLDECAAFATHHGYDLPADRLKQIHDRTQGWPVGVRLLLEHDQPGTPEASATSEQAIFEYFATEILNRVTAETRDFLLKTAYLPAITIPRAKAITTHPNPEELLLSLEDRGLFTQRLGPGTWRYHPLFREFLAERSMELLAEDDRRTLCSACAEVLLGDQQPDYAISLLRKIEDWERMAQVIEEHGEAMVFQGRIGTVQAWIESLPAALCDSKPGLNVLLGRCQLFRDVPAAKARLEQAFETFNRDGNIHGAFSAGVGVIDSIHLSMDSFDELDAWIDWLRANSENIDALSLPAAAQIALTTILALIWRKPQDEEVRRWIGRAREYSRRLAVPELVVRIDAAAMMYFSAVADVESCRVFQRRLQAYLEKHADDISPVAILSALSDFAHFAVIEGRGRDGFTYVEEGLALADRTGVHVWDHLLCIMGIWSCRLNRSHHIIPRLIQRLSAAVHPGQLSAQGILHIVLTHRSILEGDLTEAKRHARIAMQNALESGAPFPLGNVCPQTVMVLTEVGELKEASSVLLAGKEAMAGSELGPYHEAVCLLAEANLRLVEGQREPAVQLLKEGIQKGRPLGWVTVVEWVPSTIARLCVTALEEGIEVDYVRKVIREQRVVLDSRARPLEEWPWRAHVRVLGSAQIAVDGQTSAASRRARPLALLGAILALGGVDVAQERLEDALWPDADGDVARGRFNTTLHRLRKLLGAREMIVVSGGKISLNSQMCWVDVWAVDVWMRELRDAVRDGGPLSDSALKTAEQLVATYRGPFLADDESWWSIEAREKLHAEVVATLSGFTALLEDAGDHLRSLELYAPLVSRFPAEESFSQGYVKCCLELERFAEGQEVYERLCRHAERAGKKLSKTTHRLGRACAESVSPPD